MAYKVIMREIWFVEDEDRNGVELASFRQEQDALDFKDHINSLNEEAGNHSE